MAATADEDEPVNSSIDDDSLEPSAQDIQRWSEPVPEAAPTVELPIRLSLNRAQRLGGVTIFVLSVGGAWYLLPYVKSDVWDGLWGVAPCVILPFWAISLSVSTVRLDEDEYTEIGAWGTERVPLSSVVQVRHHDDIVALVTDTGDVRLIGPLGDNGSNTLSHGLPAGATTAGVAAAVERARLTSIGAPPRAHGHRLPPGYPWAALVVGVLLVRLLTVFVS